MNQLSVDEFTKYVSFCMEHMDVNSSSSQWFTLAQKIEEYVKEKPVENIKHLLSQLSRCYRNSNRPLNAVQILDRFVNNEVVLSDHPQCQALYTSAAAAYVDIYKNDPDDKYAVLALQHYKKAAEFCLKGRNPQFTITSLDRFGKVYNGNDENIVKDINELMLELSKYKVGR